MNKIRKAIRSRSWVNASTMRVLLLCFFAATAFWFLNALNSNYSTTVRYPLTFLYDETQYIAKSALPDNVQINITGLGWNLFRNNLGIKVAPLTFPLERPSETKKIAGSSLTGFFSDQLDEFNLNYILTDTLFIDIDRIVDRTIHVTVDSSKVPLPSNFRMVSKLTFFPDTVVLRGAESVVEGLPDTLRIKLAEESIKEDYSNDVPVTFENSQLVSRNPATIHVSFEVDEFVRAQKLVPLRLVNFPENGSAYLEQNTALVNYLTALEDSENISEDEFLVAADYKTLNIKDSTIEISLLEYSPLALDVALDTSRIKVQYNAR